MYIGMYTCYIRMYVICIHAMCMYVCVCVCVHEYIYLCTSTYIHVCAGVCMCVCVSVCVCVYICVYNASYSVPPLLLPCVCIAKKNKCKKENYFVSAGPPLVTLLNNKKKNCGRGEYSMQGQRSYQRRDPPS